MAIAVSCKNFFFPESNKWWIIIQFIKITFKIYRIRLLCVWIYLIILFVLMCRENRVLRSQKLIEFLLKRVVNWEISEMILEIPIRITQPLFEFIGICLTWNRIVLWWFESKNACFSFWMFVFMILTFQHL